MQIWNWKGSKAPWLGRSGLSPCPGVTKSVTEGGTGTWHRVGSQRWAQRQCGIGRRALDSGSGAARSVLSPAPDQLCDIGQGGHLPFLDLFPSLLKDPSSPKMLESSEQDKALQKGLPGCQFEAELAVGGAGESIPA